MTVKPSIDPARLLEEQLAQASPDLLRELLTTFINTLMSAEANAVCGAEYGVVSPDRSNRRNGYRARDFDTRAGTLDQGRDDVVRRGDLAVPKLRAGTYFPEWLLERRKRAERALTSVVATCYLLGVSTRRMDKLVQSLGPKAAAIRLTVAESLSRKALAERSIVPVSRQLQATAKWRSVMRKSTIALAVALTMGVVSAAFIPTSTAAVSAVAGAEATDGAWTAPFTPAGPTSRVIGVHSVMLYTGKVLVFGALRPTSAYVYDPVTGTTTQTNPPADVECGAMATLQDGRVLVVGGHGKGATGIDNIVLFDPITLTWTAQPISPQGRYYPTATTLPNGDVLISGGFTHSGANNTDVEVWTPPPAGSSVGTLRNVGQHLGGLYPHQWVLPNGKVLEVTSRSTSLLDLATWTWTPLPKPISKHYSGEGAVLLPGSPAGSTTVALIGGGNATGAVTGVESFNATTSTWTRLASLPQPRAHMSPVLLPDGSVLGVGGNSKGNFDLPQYTALRYVPGTSSWTTLAAQVERRGYHSSAVLLPDGRVFSAGDTGPGGGGNTDEIYSPSYLFQGSRPSITSAPTQVGHGAQFTITTPDTASRAVLMSPGAATHTVDFSERHIELEVTPDAGGITATAPGDTVALTGYYMLFLVDANGVPSTATWIHIG